MALYIELLRDEPSAVHIMQTDEYNAERTV